MVGTKERSDLGRGDMCAPNQVREQIPQEQIGRRLYSHMDVIAHCYTLRRERKNIDRAFSGDGLG
jgi:hypothetical protein